VSRSSSDRNINTSDKASTSKQAGQQAEPDSEIVKLRTDSTFIGHCFQATRPNMIFYYLYLLLQVLFDHGVDTRN